MFIDEAEIYVKAGKGGDGAVSFRREKYVPKGGPDGGDGGNGGDIIFEVDNHVHGLALYDRQERFLAENGQNGMGKKMAGKGGKDLILKVPAGTQIYQKEDLLVDLVNEGEKFVAARGGKGGLGNQHFATPENRTPRFAEKGGKGDSAKLKLVIKIIADIGLIGLPNAGKSTLLSVLSNAKPKIANYPFTTLEPNLGVIKGVEKNIIIADIPGLIKGASVGKGIGDKFLKHIERTKVLVHLVSALSEDPMTDYKVIRGELEAFSDKLSQKEEIIVISQIDTVDKLKLTKIITKLKRVKKPILAISAVTGENINQLKHDLENISIRG